MRYCLTIFFLVFGALCHGQGLIITVAGNGIGDYTGDGTPATDASMHAPNGLCLDAAGNIYIADGLYNNVVRKVSAATGIITTIAGTGAAGSHGDGGQATAAQLYGPSGVYVNATGDVFITEAFGNVIRKIDASTGIIHTIAGNGSGAYWGDGGPATDARVYVPTDITGDAAGNLYFSEYGSSTVRKITAATGKISTIAGTGTTGVSVDGAQATNSRLNHPHGLCVDNAGNVYVTDAQSYRIRKISAATGAISTVAGNGADGYSGDGGAATAARLFNPASVHVDAAGNMYIADASNNRIRKVNAGGIISTIAGTGTTGYSGDGADSRDARLWAPSGMAITTTGVIYFSDGGNNVIRKIAAPTAVAHAAQYAGVQCYPNPVRDVLHLVGIPAEAEYRVVNVLGVEVLKGRLQRGENTIAMGNLSNGVYIVDADEWRRSVVKE